ncbi:MAG: hypothetical protein O3B87_05245 [bacterium]|nr:hypothetical protein [bacterium]
MAQVYVKVEVDLDEFDDDDLIDEIESRGWLVREKEKEFLDLTSDELDYIVDLVINCKPGTTGREIYDKLKKR